MAIDVGTCPFCGEREFFRPMTLASRRILRLEPPLSSRKAAFATLPVLDCGFCGRAYLDPSHPIKEPDSSLRGRYFQIWPESREWLAELGVEEWPGQKESI